MYIICRIGCYDAIKKVAQPVEGQLHFVEVCVFLIFHNQCSLLDAVKLDAAFTQYGPFDAVIHFAAFKHVGESQSKPLEYYENNICGSIQLLKAMRSHNCKRLSILLFL